MTTRGYTETNVKSTASVAGADELTFAPLGEELVLFRNRSGEYGLIAEFCPHRRASLVYGIPTEDGIRCPYHGWKYASANSFNSGVGSTLPVPARREP